MLVFLPRHFSSLFSFCQVTFLGYVVSCCSLSTINQEYRECYIIKIFLIYFNQKNTASDNIPPIVEAKEKRRKIIKVHVIIIPTQKKIIPRNTKRKTKTHKLLLSSFSFTTVLLAANCPNFDLLRC
jgi:hypothetical protein